MCGKTQMTLGALLLVFSVVRSDSNNNGNDTEIIFPPECDGKDICYLKPKNYPEQKFHSLFKDLKRIRRSPRSLELSQGYIDDQYADENCRAIYELKTPFGVQDGNILKPVIQLPYFQQTIRTVRCVEEKAACMNQVLDDPSYKATCTTTYGSVNLQIYNSKTKRKEKREISIPVWCNCNIE